MRTILAALLVVSLCGADGALAASSIAISNGQTITYASEPSVEESDLAAQEQCGGQDMGCTLLLSCAAAGFGAYAAGPAGSAIGVACGFVSARDAQEEALRHCRARLPGKGCKIMKTWAD